jgi:hypothetical protein
MKREQPLIAWLLVDSGAVGIDWRSSLNQQQQGVEGAIKEGTGED